MLLRGSSARVYLSQYLHVAHRVFDRPLADAVKIAAFVVRVELRPRQRIAFDHVKSEDTDIRGALGIHAQYFQAVVC